MPAPYNYMQYMPQVDLSSKFAGLGQALAQRQERKAAEELKKQYAADLQNALSNPNAQAFAELSAKYPSQREAFKQSWEMLNQDQRDQEFLAGAQAFNAINSGNVDAARTMIDERITAMQNSGMPTEKLRAMRTALDTNPEMVSANLGLVLSSVDPERWTKIAGEQRTAMKAPFEMTEARAKADKAAVEAKFAESNAVKDLEKKGWDIEKIKLDADIAKQNASIAALEQQLKKEELDYKKNEMKLKLIEKQEARDAAIREKTASVNQGTFAIDNMLNTVDKVLLNPELVDVIGPMEGKLEPEDMTAGFRLSDREADAIALINQLKSQAFVANVPLMKGLGTLTDAEGARLENLLGSLARTQSDEGFKESLAEIQRLLLKSRKMLAEKYGVPQPAMDTPAASARGAGMTIDQILEELGVGQ